MNHIRPKNRTTQSTTVLVDKPKSTRPSNARTWINQNGIEASLVDAFVGGPLVRVAVTAVVGRWSSSTGSSGRSRRDEDGVIHPGPCHAGGDRIEAYPTDRSVGQGRGAMWRRAQTRSGLSSPDWGHHETPRERNSAPSADVASFVSPSTATLRTRARLAGAAAAAVALAVGELVSAFGPSGQSLVGGVGNEIVDRAAGGIVRFAIELFGTADKTVLVIGIVVISLLLGAWLGRLTLDRPWAGPVGFGVFGLLGAVAGIRDPLSSDAVVVARRRSAPSAPEA